jgi:hypothetical protein
VDVARGVDVGHGPNVGRGVALGRGVAVEWGVAVGRGVCVGHGLAVGQLAALVGRGLGGPGAKGSWGSCCRGDGIADDASAEPNRT